MIAMVEPWYARQPTPCKRIHAVATVTRTDEDPRAPYHPPARRAGANRRAGNGVARQSHRQPRPALRPAERPLRRPLAPLAARRADLAHRRVGGLLRQHPQADRRPGAAPYRLDQPRHPDPLGRARHAARLYPRPRPLPRQTARRYPRRSADRPAAGRRGGRAADGVRAARPRRAILAGGLHAYRGWASDCRTSPSPSPPPPSSWRNSSSRPRSSSAPPAPPLPRPTAMSRMPPRSMAQRRGRSSA